MENYKKEIYRLWAEKGAANFLAPDQAFIASRSKQMKESVIDAFFGGDKNISIVDLGCSWGLFLKACKDAGYHNVAGVDSVGQCVAFAKEKLGIANITVGIIEEYVAALPDGSCDIITAFDVMEHFEKSEILSMLIAIHKKLKRGGTFIMQVPNAGSISGLYIFYSDITHTMPFTDMLIEELFCLAGFESTKVLAVSQPTSMVVSIFRAVRDAIFAKLGRNKFSHVSTIMTVAKK